MTERPSPPSIRDFDYFADGVEPVGVDDLYDSEALQEGLDEQLRTFRRRQRRHIRFMLLMTAAMVASLWLLWGERHLMRYAFSPATPPRQMGNVTNLTPADIPTNTYVEVQGITEPRGLSQKIVHGLSLVREKRWYYRLLGSRGVFIEVPPDKKRYGFATRVDVAGRAVDPARDHSYDTLLKAYDKRFLAENRPTMRIIQVGVKPGHGRVPFFVAFVLLSGLAASNVIAFMRLLRFRRRRPG